MLIDLIVAILGSFSIIGLFFWGLYGFAGRPAVPVVGRRARAARRERQAAECAEADRLLALYNAEVARTRWEALRALTAEDRSLLLSWGWEMPPALAAEVRIEEARVRLEEAYRRDDREAIEWARARVSLACRMQTRRTASEW